jgi:diaminopimelate epimerase
MKNKITQIEFVKMVASGNDFVVIETRNQPAPAKRSGPGKPETRELELLSKKICDRKYGVGADGLLVIEKSKVANFRMRVFNPDGSEAEMCGNGLRCVSLFTANRKPLTANRKIKIETKAGILEASVSKDLVKVSMNEPQDLKLDISLNISGEKYVVNFVNTGVPHTVLFVNNLRDTNVKNLGRYIRFHPKFLPQGTNVDFVEIENKKNILVRTYERGVEDETLACGTGSVAAAIITGLKVKVKGLRCKINVETQGGEILHVYFDNLKNKISNVHLEGKAKIVFIGKFIYH